MDHHEVGLQHHHCTQTAAEWHLMRAGGETLLTLQMASETSGWCPCSRQGVSPSPVSLTRTVSAELGVVCCLGLAEQLVKKERKKAVVTVKMSLHGSETQPIKATCHTFPILFTTIQQFCAAP